MDTQTYPRVNLSMLGTNQAKKISDNHCGLYAIYTKALDSGVWTLFKMASCHFRGWPVQKKNLDSGTLGGGKKDESL